MFAVFLIHLLLMPFGFHLAMDTLPSGNCEWLQVSLVLFPAFAFVPV